jgi:type IV pilus assembly protein PilC
MPRFAYTARDLSGEETTGHESAESADEIVDQLHRRGLVVLSVDQNDGADGPSVDLLTRIKQIPTILPGMSGVGVKTLALFTRQLATMISAGLPLVRGLQSLARDEKNKEMKRILAEVSEDLHGGLSFSESLAKHPHAFNGLYTAMIKSGERSGSLDRVLDQMGEYLEKADALQTKVKSAMAYPAFVFFFSIGAMLFLMLKVIPTFEGIYKDFGAKLPAPTQFVLNLSAWMRHNFLLGLLLAVAAVVVFQLYRRTTR